MNEFFRRALQPCSKLCPKYSINGTLPLWNVAQYESQMQSHVLQTEKMSTIMKAGIIFDYLIKPVREDSMKATILQAMDHRKIAKL